MHSHHTVRALDADLNIIQQQLLDLGHLALEQTGCALHMLEQCPSGASSNEHSDEAINNAEVSLDASIVSLLARRQPVGEDLREVMAIARSVTDIERIGDEANLIAEHARAIVDINHAAGDATGGLADDPAAPLKLSRESLQLADLAIEMLDGMLKALAAGDGGQAVMILHRQSELDAAFQHCLQCLADSTELDGANAARLVHTVLINRALQRIGAHACNLAEHQIYALRGADIRHG